MIDLVGLNDRCICHYYIYLFFFYYPIIWIVNNFWCILFMKRCWEVRKCCYSHFTHSELKCGDTVAQILREIKCLFLILSAGVSCLPAFRGKRALQFVKTQKVMHSTSKQKTALSSKPYLHL